MGDTGIEPVTSSVSGKRAPAAPIARADDGTRTRDPHLGKVMLYQLSHTSSYLLPERVFSRSQCSQYIMLLKVRQYFFEIFLDILRVSVIMV